MEKVILCTKNKGKLKEFKELFAMLGINLELISLFDLNEEEDVLENGNTFKENAYLKASFYFNKYHLPTIADDSGLCIDAIGGKPGINSARYSGFGPKENIKKVLKELEGVKMRQAHFNCDICFIDQDGNDYYFNGKVNGYIGYSESGDNGFGYDPIFMVNYLGKDVSMASLSEEHKNHISHRYNALLEFAKWHSANNLKEENNE